MNRSFYFLILFLFSNFCVWAESEPLLAEDFDGDTSSGLAHILLKHQHISLAPGGGPDGTNAIRAEYVGCEIGTERIVRKVPLSRPVKSATLSFDVKFDEDFQWTKGGKLHGLGPEHEVSGGDPRQPKQWSSRVVFHTRGRAATYVYDQAEEKKYGIVMISKGPVFTKGKWHHVELHVRLNDPDEANGLAHLYIDGKLVVAHEDIVYRGDFSEETLIRKFLFSTFHGGDSPNYTPVDADGNPTTVHAWFDNFLVTEGPEDIGS